MKIDWHKTIETTFNATKIAALIIAGAWTYYQWDKVLFPKESAEQNARQANLRTDLRMSFEAAKIQGLGEPFELTSDGSSGDSSNIGEKGYLVEVSGLISIENTRPFPIELTVAAATLDIETGIQIDADAALQPVTYTHTETIQLDSEYVFGDLVTDGFVIESGGVARLAYRAPVVVQGNLLTQPHEYVFGATFDLSAVGDLETVPVDGRSKSKLVLSSVLVNGPIEAGLQSDTEGETAVLPRSATRIDLGELQSGGILGGSNSIIRKPLGDIIKW